MPGEMKLEATNSFNDAHAKEEAEMKMPRIEPTVAAIVTLAGAVMFAGGAIAASFPQSSEGPGMTSMYAGAIVGLFGLVSLWREDSAESQ